MHPPHLPPKQEKTTRRIQDFGFYVFLTVLLSFVAGTAAATIAFTWVLPPFPSNSGTVTFFQNNQDAGGENELTSQEKEDVLERTVKIFDKRKKLPGEFYDGAAYFGEATLLTLDGWAVLPLSGLSPADVPFLEAMDNQGRILSVEKIVNEPVTGLTYLDIQGQGFSVFSLVNTQAFEPSEVWVLKKNEFVPTPLLVTISQTKESAKPLTQLTTRVTSAAPVSAFAVSEKGELVGLVDKNATLIPAVEINRHLRFLQKNDIIVSKSLPFVGYTAEGVQKDATGKTQVKYGFVVTDVGTKIKTGIVNNDIIIRIQGKDFQPRTAREDVLNAPDEMTVTVLRQGKEIDVKINKI